MNNWSEHDDRKFQSQAQTFKEIHEFDFNRELAKQDAIHVLANFYRDRGLNLSDDVDTSRPFFSSINAHDCENVMQKVVLVIFEHKNGKGTSSVEFIMDKEGRFLATSYGEQIASKTELVESLYHSRQIMCGED